MPTCSECGAGLYFEHAAGCSVNQRHDALTAKLDTCGVCGLIYGQKPNEGDYQSSWSCCPACVATAIQRRSEAAESDMEALKAEHERLKAERLRLAEIANVVARSHNYRVCICSACVWKRESDGAL